MCNNTLPESKVKYSMDSKRQCGTEGEKIEVVRKKRKQRS